MDHNSAAPTVDPMHTVIYTTELCEQILSHLECEDLTRARRVCHYFKYAIDLSPHLRQVLFLTPSSTETLGLSCLRETVLTSASGSQEQVSRTGSEGKSRNGFSPTYHDLHPALQFWDDHDLTTVPRLREVFDDQGKMGHHRRWGFLKFTDRLASQTTLLSQVSLLDDMFICQPPLSTLIGRLTATQNHPSVRLLIHEKDSIKFKHILEHLSRQDRPLGNHVFVWEEAIMGFRS
jgi:hypothetical protein